MANHVIYDRLWESKKLSECSRDAAMAYPWIFLVADDHGRFEYRPARIWAKVFGGRKDVSLEDVSGWLTEYFRVGLLLRYHIDGDLAHWYKFKGRKLSERRKSEYPDPLDFPPFTEIVTGGAEKRGSGGDEARVEPRQIDARDRSRTDLEQNGEQIPVAIAPAPWNREAAELWTQEYRGSAPKQFFSALKPLVKAHGWERVRPALVTYLAETPVEYVNLVKAFVGAFGTWELKAQGVSRAPPGKATTGDRTVAAMREFVMEESGDHEIGVLGGLRQIGSGSTSDAGRSDPDGLPRSAGGRGGP